jgi:hypothetical protein
MAARNSTRSSVPVWRTGKPDAALAAAVDVAREAVRSIGADEFIGAHLGAKSEGERIVTHLFECTMTGYRGWQWFAVLTRLSRSKVATVNEVGLLPGENSVLAPDWVPWAARVRPEDNETVPKLDDLVIAETPADTDDEDSDDDADRDDSDAEDADSGAEDSDED